MSSKFIDAHEAARWVASGDTVCTVGMTLIGAAESILSAIEARFLTAGEPRDLTLLHAAGQSDRQRGIQHFAHPGMGSSGQAIPGLAITIRNDRQQPLPAGQIGHIWLKGDVVIREYWQHSERRPSCDAQGWFCTGDLGYLDDEGWLYIKDRSKDMINRGGEKIYSLELENILSTYRGVREVAVIPTPSPVYGEEPVAFIVPDGQHHLTSEEILDWLKVKIARFKLPARIIFTRALPRTHNGKVSKQQLKTRLAESIITLSTEDKK